MQTPTRRQLLRRAQICNMRHSSTSKPLCRYNVYIESGAWATNFKQKLASGSPVFAIDPRSPEFFSRALRPGVHYVPLRFGDMCNQTVDTVS